MRSTSMRNHARSQERRKARLILRNRLRAYFSVLRLYALAKAEDDRRSFGAFEKRAREQGSSRPTI